MKIVRKDEDTAGKKKMTAGYIRNQLYEEQNDELDYNEGAHTTVYGQEQEATNTGRFKVVFNSCIPSVLLANISPLRYTEEEVDLLCDGYTQCEVVAGK